MFISGYTNTGNVFYCLVYVIAWAQGQLRINFTPIFKVFTKLPESRGNEGNFENFQNTSEINPELPEGTCDYLFITSRAKLSRASFISSTS